MIGLGVQSLPTSASSYLQFIGAIASRTASTLGEWTSRVMVP
jgi:hypothetical protein